MTLPSDTFQRSMTVLDVTDMERSLAFYRDKLGFQASTWGEPTGFAILQRGTVSIALNLSEQKQSGQNQWWAAYIYVADAQKVRDEFVNSGVTIHRDIEETFYGCRDFDVIDPDGYILGVGQPLNIHPDDLGPGLGPDLAADDTTTNDASRS